jgi:hypothetical protein
VAEEFQTVDVLRPGVGKRYSSLPVDHVDVTGFHTNYDGSPLRPQLLDIRVGDKVFWYDDGERYQARIDEVVVTGNILRVAFADPETAPPEW